MYSALPKLGVFQNVWNEAFLLLYYSACKRATAMVFKYGEIENISPFVLNTKRPLRDIWLLRYLVSNIINIWKTWKSVFFWKFTKLFCLYLSNQISFKGRFVLKMNGRILQATKMLYFENKEKTSNFWPAAHTLGGA